LSMACQYSTVTAAMTTASRAHANIPARCAAKTHRGRG
jgi:hypothetical protein